MFPTPNFLVLVGFLFPISLFSLSFLFFYWCVFVLFISPKFPMEKGWKKRRELPSALVRAAVAPWDLAVSKLPAILDRYSQF